jgi:serine kinase of HPr protein (carbohydrate metabolism regulator)
MKKNILHGSAVALSGKAVFLRGASGSGKSDLAFRLVNLGFALIADDQVEFKLRLDRVYAGAVESVKGLLEIRGVGLVKFPPAGAAALALVIDLVAAGAVPRLPEWEAAEILGVRVPRLRLHAFDASTPLKILKAMELVEKPDLLVK